MAGSASRAEITARRPKASRVQVQGLRSAGQRLRKAQAFQAAVHHYRAAAALLRDAGTEADRAAGLQCDLQAAFCYMRAGRPHWGVRQCTQRLVWRAGALEEEEECRLLVRRAQCLEAMQLTDLALDDLRRARELRPSDEAVAATLFEMGREGDCEAPTPGMTPMLSYFEAMVAAGVDALTEEELQALQADPTASELSLVLTRLPSPPPPPRLPAMGLPSGVAGTPELMGGVGGDLMKELMSSNTSALATKVLDTLQEKLRDKQFTTMILGYTRNIRDDTIVQLSTSLGLPLRAPTAAFIGRKLRSLTPTSLSRIATALVVSRRVAWAAMAARRLVRDHANVLVLGVTLSFAYWCITRPM